MRYLFSELAYQPQEEHATEYQTTQYTPGQFVVGVNYGITSNLVAGVRYTYQVAEKSTYPFACCSVPLPVTYELESSAVVGTLEFKL